MSDCIFCKILSGEIPSATVYEDDEFKAILDRFPSNKGHVLILPKTHVANIFEIDPLPHFYSNLPQRLHLL